MFAFIKGQLVTSTPLSVVIETGGVGYHIYIPANVFGTIPQIGQGLLLYTSFVVRELSQTLYGFLSIQEKELFEQFMGVTGIGPKLALSLVGHMAIHDLQNAISSHDIATICKIPGIGKKTAERLIIELRDKLATFTPPQPHGITITSFSSPQNQKISDAMSALINLGYNQGTAQKAIKKTLKDMPEDTDLATLITNSLKNV